jgi:PAS domain S-box-containing protein
MFDVTERRAAEEALREAERRFRTLVEQIPAATYVWNSLRDPGGGDFLYVSPQVEKMLGIPPERWMAEPELWRSRVHPDDYDKVAEVWAQTDRTGRSFDAEYRMYGPDDGLVWVHDHAVVVERDDDGAPRLWQGVLFDITERKRHEHERQRLLTRLVQAQEEERRRIALDIHDDSVQKMTAVGLRLEALRNRVSDADMRGRMGELEDIVGLAIRRLRHLLFELRPPALDKDGLAAALSQYLVEVGEEAELEPVLVNRVAEEPPIEVRTLAYRIAQEAVTNARKHAAARNLEVTLESRGGGIYVRVMDDGRGFPGESLEAPGHLGMLTMRERAELSGGWLRISSQQGRGTTVEFWLPG